MAKGKTVSMHFELVEYLSYFGPVFLQAFLIWSFNQTSTIIPFMLLMKFVLPFLDSILPLDMKNRTPQEQEELEKDWRYLVPLYFYVAIDLYFSYWLLNVLYYQFPLLSLYQKILFMLQVGSDTGNCIVVGHELTHRRHPLHYFFGNILFFRVLFTHFPITHTQGHHKWVATPLDPGSAPQGQSVYPFAVRSMYYSFWMGWGIEKERQFKKNPKLGTIALVLNNQIFKLKLLEVIYFGVICYFWGVRVMLLAVLCGFLQSFSFEIINYVEHYGLRRKEIAPGKYEKATVMHSWNAAQRITNAFLFKVQRHSDHHENGYKAYQALCSYEKSPQLPHGYSLSLVLALQPKLWFEMMDPLVNAYQNEHRQPTREELKKFNKIANKALMRSTVQMTVISLLGLFL